MDQDTNGQNIFEPPIAKKTSPILLIGGGVVIGLAVIALGYYAFSALFGGGDVAKSVPDDAAFYVGVDMTELMDQEAQELFEIFQDGIDEDVVDEFIEDMEDALGVTFEDDVLPWIGSSAGFTLYDIDFDDYGSLDDADALFIFSVRDKKKADEFIEDIIDHLEDEMDMEFDDSEYEGATIYIGDEEFAIDRYNKYLYVGISENTVEDAIDAAKGDSLADMKEYKNILSELPKGRLMTLYVASDAMQDIMDGMTTTLYYDLPMSDDIEVPETSIGMSLMVTSEGFQIDSVSLFDEQELPDAQIELLKAQTSKLETPSMFPEDTFLFIASHRMDLALQIMEETSNDVYDEFEESMELFDDEFGIDILSLWLALDGEFALGVFPESAGFFAEVADTPIGWQFVASSSQEDEFADAFEDLASLAEDDMGMLVDEDSFDDVDYYIISDEYSETDVMSFGNGDGYIFLSSDIDVIEDGYDGKNSLADSDLYKDSLQAFSRSVVPVFYFDLQELLDVIRETVYDEDYFEESTAVFDPITAIAAGVEKYSRGKTHSVMIIFVDK